jgi:hypothetical protein
MKKKPDQRKTAQLSLKKKKTIPGQYVQHRLVEKTKKNMRDVLKA